MLPNELTIAADSTIRQALELLDRTGEKILLLVSAGGELKRTITDGDIRRLILDGVCLDDRLTILPPLAPKCVSVGVDHGEILRLMNEHGLDHIPVVRSDGTIESLVLRKEIDSEILLSTPHLGNFEREYVDEAFRTNWVAPLGPNVDAFERELASEVGVVDAAALSSGTAAIHLALAILGVGRGDVVFCSSLTFVASANPILYLGATPVFIDSDPETWTMSVSALARALRDGAQRGELPKAVVVVNLYGQSADFNSIRHICAEFEIPIVEDSAESLGASYRGVASGTCGDIGIYSFNGNKIITTSGGGMLVSNNRAFVQRARFLSTQARESAPYYEHTTVGYNYRMSNVLAGIGRGQLKVLRERVEARRAVFSRYAAGLSSVKFIEWMPEAPYGRCTRWLTAALLVRDLFPKGPQDLISFLSHHKIEARRVWKPMHMQPLFAQCRYYAMDEDFDFSSEAFSRGICLPSGSNMQLAQQDRIIDVLKRFPV